MDNEIHLIFFPKFNFFLFIIFWILFPFSRLSFNVYIELY